MFHTPEYIRYEKDIQPQLFVVIDTEEEFNWSKGPDSEANTVQSIQKLHLIQDIFNEYDITPCYVVDYPVASQKDSVKILKNILDQGQCEIGAHLHPWVNPPLIENLTISNMYPGNLSYDQEFSKLQSLTEMIKTSFGISPEIYRAGRYGIGKNTTKILQELGYTIDLSVFTSFDLSGDGGPDFSNFKADPYWFGDNRDLLEIPLSAAFVGFSGKLSKMIYNSAVKLDFIKAQGILARLSVVDRLSLSPEGFTTDEHKKLTHFLYNQGIRTFNWNLHSPTVVPGTTGYTETKQDVNDFLDSFRRYFDFFFGEFNGVATTPTQIKKDLELNRF